MVPHDTRTVVLIERLDSPQPLRIVRPLGARSLLHIASNGKAVLAHQTVSELEAYLARPLKASTPRTITDPHKLRSELDRVRKQGYAVSMGELDEGVRAVAAAILGPDERPVGSLSISCPAQRLPDERIARYGAWVRAAAKEIGRLVSGH
jgi:DNA-binding IclR family transcriptional regulator